MPLDRYDAIPDISDPSIIIGPRKCHQTERVLENGDPLTYKRARKTHVSTPVTATNASRPSADKENLTMLTLSSMPQSTCPDSNEGGDERGGEVTDEDEDAELSM